jgi:uncharacterized protein YuzE
VVPCRGCGPESLATGGRTLPRGARNVQNGVRKETSPLTVTIAGIEFDSVVYDSEGDILYLHVGDPSTAVDFDASPEGHHLRYGSDGQLVGITIVNARSLLFQEGKITVALPQMQLEASDLEGILTAA